MLPAMGGEVKAHLSLAPKGGVLTSGVRPQALLARSGQRDPVRVVVDRGRPIDAVGRADVDVAAFRCRRNVEAVMHSACCGNHPAIGASAGQSFIRLSGGA